MANTLSPEQESYLNTLEDLMIKIQKSQTNFKKSPKARLTEGYVRARLESIEEYWKLYSSVNQELTKCTTREQKNILPYFLNEDYYKCEEFYLWYRADMLDLLHSNKKQSDLDISTRSYSSEASSSCVKLPRIELPTFSGHYEEFSTFQDLFTTLVHNNTSLSKVQKLHYLKLSVTGEAASLLKHINVTENNYEQAWDILKKRYGNKRLIVNSILKRFFSVRKVSTQTSTQIKMILDTTSECINSLQNLEISTETWNPIIIYIVVQKLDYETHKSWEEYIYRHDSDELPTWEELKNFLESKYRTMELVTSSNYSGREIKPVTQKSFHISNETNERLTTKSLCTFCKEDHFIYHCKEFSKQSVEKRHDFALKNKLCFNCLVPNHTVPRCKQQTSCKICKRRHHSLLHIEKIQQGSDSTHIATPSNLQTTEVQVTTHYSSEQQPIQNVLLATALVDVTTSTGECHTLRALIDQGSEASFITSRVVDILKLKKNRINGSVCGIGEGRHHLKYKVQLSISTKHDPIHLEAYVMKTISSLLPAQNVMINLSELTDIELADPTYYTPGRIDLLLGAGVFANILEDGLMRLHSGLVAQKTSLGWILSGQTAHADRESKIITSMFIREDNDLLKSFWEIDKDLYKKKKIFTKEEEECETIYTTTTQKDIDGKYIVHLPLKQSIEETVKQVGYTKEKAIKRFLQLEKKFEKNKILKEEYTKVIKEYVDMGHMKKLEVKEDNNTIYLPHHAVIRQDKDTTKVRVVFDASAKGSNGLSLNDTMMTGPVLQQDLRSLIILWRVNKICFVGDIMKMYRMIKMFEDHTKLQCIVWRDNPDEDLQGYKLTTVTFGTAAAPFLAVRSLMQLADDEVDYPEAANTIKNSFYVDDLMGGHEDVEEAKKLCQDIKYVLKKGGFKMQKWSSNSEEVLQYIKEDNNIKENLEIKLDKIIKILGLTWDRKDDTFKITINLPELTHPVTKRSILSDIARLFDPFGWLSPVVIVAKVFIQKLWLCSLGWDEDLPEDLKEEWKSYRKNLPDLQPIEVPRWFHTSSRSKVVEIHGFADASISSYAAVTYLRVVDEDDVVQITMIASRTKVAPLKQLTIPRLELCAAALLAELIKEVSDLLKIPVDHIYAYTDSMVVLSWLQSQPSRWHTFVANRVAEILRVLTNNRWSQIQSSENPADVASRGVEASELQNNKLWWYGPEWLKNKNIHIKRSYIPQTELEMKSLFHTNIHEEEKPIWERFSSLSRMKRVLSYCRRLLLSKDKVNKKEYITTEEMEIILQKFIQFYQSLIYEKALEDIKKEGKVKPKSSLVTLVPFIDKNGIMKVGGRLQNADLPEEAKHPIIIPREVHLTKLIIQEAHIIRTLHGGIQLMMAFIRSRFWIINLKSSVKHCIRNCKVCIIAKAKVKTQRMGQLPAVRVNPHRVFFNTGVDYAGPVYINNKDLNGKQVFQHHRLTTVKMALGLHRRCTSWNGWFGTSGYSKK